MLGSVEVMGGDFGLRNHQWLHFFGFHGNHVLLMLQSAGDQQKWMVDHCGVILLEQLGGNDDIRDARFVFQAQENKALSRPRTLPQ